jgi:hypothetical protein
LRGRGPYSIMATMEQCTFRITVKCMQGYIYSLQNGI